MKGGQSQNLIFEFGFGQVKIEYLILRKGTEAKFSKTDFGFFSKEAEFWSLFGFLRSLCLGWLAVLI